MTANEQNLVDFISFLSFVSISSFNKGGHRHRRKLLSEQNVFLVTGLKRATRQCARCAEISSFPCPLFIKKLLREMLWQAFQMSRPSSWFHPQPLTGVLNLTNSLGDTRLVLISVPTSLRFLTVWDCHGHQRPPASGPAFKVKVSPVGIVQIVTWKTQWGDYGCSWPYRRHRRSSGQHQILIRTPYFH